MTLQAVVYIGFPAPGDKLSLKRSLARSWQHEMKEVTIRPPVLTQFKEKGHFFVETVWIV